MEITVFTCDLKTPEKCICNFTLLKFNEKLLSERHPCKDHFTYRNRFDSTDYLHLFEVTDGLDGLFTLYWGGRVTWFELDDGLSSPLQAFQVSFELSQLLFLVL